MVITPIFQMGKLRHKVRWQRMQTHTTPGGSNGTRDQRPRHPEASRLGSVLLTRRDPVGSLGGGSLPPDRTPSLSVVWGDSPMFEPCCLTR